MPRIDGCGAMNRAMRADLAARGLPEDAAKQWANALARMAWGYRLPFGLKNMGPMDVPEPVRPLCQPEPNGWRLSQAGQAWLDGFRRI